MKKITASTYGFVMILFMLPSIYIGYNVYRSHIFQKQLLSEFNSQTYTTELTQQFYKVNFDLPNISIFTIPIKQLVARYYFLAEDFDTAFKLIEAGEKANPYYMYGSSLKSEIFDYLGVIDSAYFHAKRAFYKMPNNSRHYLFYLKSLVKKNNIDEVHASYEIIKRFESHDKLPQMLLSTMVSINDTTPKAKEIALDIKKNYHDETTKLAADYIVYGYDNVKESLRLSDLGLEAFKNKKYSEAAQLYAEAAKRYPEDYLSLENAGMSYVNIKDYDNAILSLKKSISLNKIPDGKAYYFLGISYYQKSITDSACIYLRKAANLNFRSSFKALTEYCN